MMKFWLTSFVVLFGLAELYQWVRHFSLPLPVFILGGAFLAIASNYDKRAGLPFLRAQIEPDFDLSAMPDISDQIPPRGTDDFSGYNAAPRPARHPRPERSISFTIRPPDEP